MQDPAGKNSRSAAADGKVYFRFVCVNVWRVISEGRPEPGSRSRDANPRINPAYHHSYAQIHATVSGLVPKVREFKSDVIIAIGGGGFIPARMLRTEVNVSLSLSLVSIRHTTGLPAGRFHVCTALSRTNN